MESAPYIMEAEGGTVDFMEADRSVTEMRLTEISFINASALPRFPSLTKLFMIECAFARPEQYEGADVVDADLSQHLQRLDDGGEDAVLVRAIEAMPALTHLDVWGLHMGPRSRLPRTLRHVSINSGACWLANIAHCPLLTLDVRVDGYLEGGRTVGSSPLCDPGVAAAGMWRTLRVLWCFADQLPDAQVPVRDDLLLILEIDHHTDMGGVLDVANMTPVPRRVVLFSETWQDGSEEMKPLLARVERRMLRAGVEEVRVVDGITHTANLDPLGEGEDSMLTVPMIEAEIGGPSFDYLLTVAEVLAKPGPPAQAPATTAADDDQLAAARRPVWLAREALGARDLGRLAAMTSLRSLHLSGTRLPASLRLPQGLKHLSLKGGVHCAANFAHCKLVSLNSRPERPHWALVDAGPDCPFWSSLRLLWVDAEDLPETPVAVRPDLTLFLAVAGDTNVRFAADARLMTPVPKRAVACIEYDFGDSMFDTGLRDRLTRSLRRVEAVTGMQVYFSRNGATLFSGGQARLPHVEPVELKAMTEWLDAPAFDSFATEYSDSDSDCPMGA